MLWWVQVGIRHKIYYATLCMNQQIQGFCLIVVKSSQTQRAVLSDPPNPLPSLFNVRVFPSTAFLPLASERLVIGFHNLELAFKTLAADEIFYRYFFQMSVFVRLCPDMLINF